MLWWKLSKIIYLGNLSGTWPDTCTAVEFVTRSGNVRTGERVISLFGRSSALWRSMKGERESCCLIVCLGSKIST